MNRKYVDLKYLQYFAPEITPIITENLIKKYDIKKDLIEEVKKELPENFFENRKAGRNESFICELIQKDLVDDFIDYVNQSEFELDLTINQSIYEINSLLLKK